MTIDNLRQADLAGTIQIWPPRILGLLLTLVCNRSETVAIGQG